MSTNIKRKIVYIIGSLIEINGVIDISNINNTEDNTN